MQELSYKMMSFEDLPNLNEDVISLLKTSNYQLYKYKKGYLLNIMKYNILFDESGKTSGVIDPIDVTKLQKIFFKNIFWFNLKWGDHEEN